MSQLGAMPRISGISATGANFTMSGSSGTATVMNGVWNNWSVNEEAIKKVPRRGILGWLLGDEEKKVTVKQHTVEEFFGLLKRGKNRLKKSETLVDNYLRSIARAESFGQTALADQLKDQVEAVRQEAKLIEGGIEEYLDSEQVESLVAKSERGIEIDFVRNFTRPIPVELLEKKLKLDEAKLFDAYVVMHYDPKKKNSQLTKQEIEKKKDPILFGLIRGSDRFYYIGDWVDEHCDLTLREAVEILGEPTRKIADGQPVPPELSTS